MAEEALKAGVAAGSTDEVIDAAYAGACVANTRVEVGSGWDATDPPLCKLLMLLGADVVVGGSPERDAKPLASEATSEFTLKAGAAAGSTDAVIDAAYAGASVVDTRMDVGPDWDATGPLLCSASCTGNVRMCKLLLLLGADVEGGSAERDTKPLAFAAAEGHLEVVTLLLDRGADVNAADKDGTTALMRATATFTRHPAVVTLLLDRGASIQATSTHGKAFDIAQLFGGGATFDFELMTRLDPRSPASIVAANADAAEAKSTAAVEAQRALVPAGTRLSLDRFKLAERLGKRSQATGYYGVNSAVFKADLDGSVVVIKVVYNVEQVTTTNLIKTFRTDYAVIEDDSKSHPNVVAGLGHFVGEASRRTLGATWEADPEFVRLNTLFVVMEPMERPLKKLISDLIAAAVAAAGGVDSPAAAAGGAAPPRSAWPPVLPVSLFLVILQRVLRALVHLLRHGIVHRDLKADNVLITYQPAEADDSVSQPTVLVKLADFGHALDTNTQRSIVNFKLPYIVEGIKGGAPAYLAPEVMAAEPGTLDDLVFIDYSKNDVFAAGMLAHYMLTNGAADAFTAEHPHYSAATYSHPPRGCPPPIADLVWAMANPSFEHRITAKEALARVDALIDGSRLDWDLASDRLDPSRA